MNNIFCKSDFIDFIEFNEYNENKYNREKIYSVLQHIAYLSIVGISVIICLTLFYHSIMYVF